MALENTYRPMQNIHAYKRLAKPQSLPSPTLAVGEDEDLTSKPVLVFTQHYDNLHRQVDGLDGNTPVENYGVVGDGFVVDESNFVSSEMFLGYPVEYI